MEFIKQDCILMSESNPLVFTELCIRNCYKSEESMFQRPPQVLIRKVIKRGHTSVLEHTGVYLVYTQNYVYNHYKYFIDNPYTDMRKEDNLWYIYTNLRVIAENDPDLLERILKDDSTVKYFTPKDDDPYKRITFRIITDHGQERSLLRHRWNSFTIESTRFINYLKRRGISFIEWQGRRKNKWIYTLACKFSTFFYKLLIRLGETPEIARSVLNLGHKTDIIMSAPRYKWKHFLDLRTAKDAHPQIREIAEKIKQFI